MMSYGIAIHCLCNPIQKLQLFESSSAFFKHLTEYRQCILGGDVTRSFPIPLAWFIFCQKYDQCNRR